MMFKLEGLRGKYEWAGFVILCVLLIPFILTAPHPLLGFFIGMIALAAVVMCVGAIMLFSVLVGGLLERMFK